MAKKDREVRPIAVGYVLKRLATKGANKHIMARRSAELQPIQLGVGVSGGAEAAIHARRRYPTQKPTTHIIVKLDFVNTFNSLRSDLIMDSVAATTQELYRFTHEVYI